MEILKYCTDCDEIQFKEDGSWAPMRSKKEVQEVSSSYNGVDGECPFSRRVEHSSCCCKVLVFNIKVLKFYLKKHSAVYG